MLDLDAELTQFLLKWNDGNQQAADKVFEVAYQELHRIAKAHVDQHQSGDTLQPTALVHEAFLRLLDANASFTNRNQFFWFMGKLMRYILTDCIRAKLTAKRGAGKVIQASQLEKPLDLLPSKMSPQLFLTLNQCLDRLAQFDLRQSQILEMYFFCDLRIQDIAENLSLSSATVKRDLRMAKAWLANQLSNSSPLMN